MRLPLTNLDVIRALRIRCICEAPSTSTITYRESIFVQGHFGARESAMFIKRNTVRCIGETNERVSLFEKTTNKELFFVEKNKKYLGGIADQLGALRVVQRHERLVIELLFRS